MTDRQQKSLEAVRTIWRQYRDEALRRVDTVHAAVAAGLEGKLDDDLRRKAVRSAHLLAGSAGTFGFHEASDDARRLERALSGVSPPASDDLPILADRVLAMRRQLESDEPPGGWG